MLPFLRRQIILHNPKEIIVNIIQLEQGMQLEKAETPIIGTGAENQFAELSSTFVRTDRDLIVIDNNKSD